MVNSLNLRRQTMLFSATKSVSQLYQVAISKPQFNNLHYSGVEGNQEVKEMVTFKIECLDIEHRNDKPVYLLKVNFHENIFGSEIDLKNEQLKHDVIDAQNAKDAADAAAEEAANAAAVAKDA